MTGLSERPQSVIGPRVFRAWWRLLRLLLWIIVPCAAVGIALVTALTGGTVGELISAAVVGGLNVGVHVAFWTTLAFCVLEHSCVETSAIPRRDTGQSSGPPAPVARPTDLVAPVVTCLILAGAVVWDLQVGWGGERARVLAPALWPGVIIALVAVLIVRIVLTVRVFRAGRWSVSSAIVHAVVSLGVSAAAIVLLARGWLLHPDLTAGFADTPARVLTAAGVTLAVVIAGVGIASTGGGFRRAVSDRTGA